MPASDIGRHIWKALSFLSHLVLLKNETWMGHPPTPSLPHSMHPRFQGLGQSLLSGWGWTEPAWLLPLIHLAEKLFCCGAHRSHSLVEKEWQASCPPRAIRASAGPSV